MPGCASSRDGTFEPGITASRVFIASGSQVYVVGLMPVWGITYDRLHFYGGALIGILTLHDSFPSPFATGPSNYIDTDVTRFALGPVAGADYDVAAGIFANASMQYAKAWGPRGLRSSARSI